MAKVYAPSERSWVVALERGVTAGEECDVDDAAAAGLTDQGWTTKRPKAASADPATDDAPVAQNQEQ